MAIILTTATQEKLLSVLQDEENLSLSVSEICKKAGISRTSYYRFLKDRDFLCALREGGIQTIYGALLQTINSVVKRAKEGSFPHQKLLIEVASLQVKARTEESSATNTNIEYEAAQEIAKLPDDKRQKVINAIQSILNE